jgi:hypothetical protein
MKVLRLLKFFRGISAIIGAIEYNLSLLTSIVGFMGFFFIIFGIIGMGLFQGATMHRCIVRGPAKTSPGAVLPPEYASASYFDKGAVGNFGEWDMWCAPTQAICPYMVIYVAWRVGHVVCTYPG